ncbi:nucleotidyltransferase substrate binding protein [Mediterraneibacter sp. NSJ-55]|uniref:Nucleotidyltransferase substrate binding protein n=1 Tax=Mediterraneibacter hominis TaxID=2763054 RepID=A0A923RPZ3_9FIRM|nr:nucleotidyltransferase substrate binding protein [Mediterraneibacter hominis]MBC5688951.1 nucleotidyltransferase substrate binding protein [Mediterraneibacter hominis]
MTVDEILQEIVKICRQYDAREVFWFGSRAKFSITFDLSWKVMKDILIQYYAITEFIADSPREVLKEVLKAELIDGDVWMEMLQC